MITTEVNFDGLVGLTHNYTGLSLGNIASAQNAGTPANPKAAAQQGLQKMQSLMQMGFTQGILPPHERPHIPTLKRLGFDGNNDAAIIAKVWKTAPELILNCISASAMWVANAATISPSPDTANHKTHITPANLSSMFHRSIEAETTGRILKSIFADPAHFEHHPPLFPGKHFGDEGAANHTRLCHQYDNPGVELFVYGQHAFKSNRPAPKRFPARQSFEASSSIARLHQLPEARSVFAQQNPDVIDLGVFHNDVIAVGNQNVLFFHEHAFLNKAEVLDEIRQKMSPATMHFIEVPDNKVSVPDAVSSYLFNSQLLSLNPHKPGSHMALIAPVECEENPRVKAYLDQLLTTNSPIQTIHYFNLRQSMRNGGGPACLRLRVTMNTAQIASLTAKVILDAAQIRNITHWIDKCYRDHLSAEDLKDPSLLNETRTALDELTQLLELGSVYDFQLP